MDWSLLPEILLAALTITAIAACVRLAGAVGKGVANISFYSLGFAIGLLGLARLFLFMATRQETPAFSEVTLHMWWHIISYLALTCMIIGGYRQKKAIAMFQNKPFGTKDTLLMGSLVLLSVLIFFLAPLLEPTLGPALTGTSVDTLGLHHLVIMVLGFVAVYYIFKLRSFTLSSMWMPSILLLGSIGAQHLWELFTESWRVVSVPEPIIEGFELILVIFGLFAINYGLLRTLRLLRKGKNA